VRITDGGFGSFNSNSTPSFYLPTAPWTGKAMYMFGYWVHHKLALLGRQFAHDFVQKISEKQKVYAYYQG
jgi:hypothetical protein